MPFSEKILIVSVFLFDLRVLLLRYKIIIIIVVPVVLVVDMFA